LLNAGHRRGAKTYRSVLHGRQVKVEAIEAFCPVALAGIGWLPDTLMSRSVIVRMRRRHQGEQIEPFRRRIHGKEGERIRDEIGAWVRSLSNQIGFPDLPHQIQDRAADIWEPLIAVADLAGGKWPRLAHGNQTYGPNGSFSTYGNTTYGPGGSTATTYGNQNTPGGRSVVCSHYGNQTYCN
jgi:Protein of unknown function (DUF3631)